MTDPWSQSWKVVELARGPAYFTFHGDVRADSGGR